MIFESALSAGFLATPTHDFVECETKPWEFISRAFLAARRQRAATTVSEKLASLVKDEELILHCQEVVRLNAGFDMPMLLDVSMRLRSEEDKQVPPGLFLALLESDEMMAALDRRLIERALEWCRHARPGRDVILNFSPTLGSIFSLDFAEFVEGALRERDLDPGVLCLEIAEDVASFLPPSVQPNIDRLTELGCSFAVGSSSCEAISRTAMRALRAKFVRISGALVQDLVQNATAHSRVTATNRLCRGAGVHTIAERVEDSSVLRRLAEIGVSYVQGLNIADSRPLAFHG
jgi:EAL domain-containing protein (putative c-di-GMP-specific phosphodiesterase class I)